MSTKGGNTKKPGLRKRHAGRRGKFSVDDVLNDFAAAYRLLDSRQLDMHAGQLVAVLRGQVVGAGPDAAALRDTVSRTYGVHPERLAIIRVVDETTVYGQATCPRSS